MSSRWLYVHGESDEAHFFLTESMTWSACGQVCTQLRDYRMVISSDRRCRLCDLRTLPVQQSPEMLLLSKEAALYRDFLCPYGGCDRNPEGICIMCHGYSEDDGHESL